MKSNNAQYALLLIHSLVRCNWCGVCWGRRCTRYCTRCGRHRRYARVLICIDVPFVGLTYWVRARYLRVTWMQNVCKSATSERTIWRVICNNNWRRSHASWIKNCWYFVIPCHFGEAIIWYRVLVSADVWFAQTIYHFHIHILCFPLFTHNSRSIVHFALQYSAFQLAHTMFYFSKWHNIKVSHNSIPWKIIRTLCYIDGAKSETFYSFVT